MKDLIGKESKHHDEKMERIIFVVLRAGVIASALLMLSGLLVLMLQPNGHFTTTYSLASYIEFLFNDPFRSPGILLAFTGIIILVLTPFVRVGASLIGFFHERDMRFFFVTLIVFALLVAELVGSLLFR